MHEQDGHALRVPTTAGRGGQGPPGGASQTNCSSSQRQPAVQAAHASTLTASGARREHSPCTTNAFSNTTGARRWMKPERQQKGGRQMPMVRQRHGGECSAYLHCERLGPNTAPRHPLRPPPCCPAPTVEGLARNVRVVVHIHVDLQVVGA